MYPLYLSKSVYNNYWFFSFLENYIINYRIREIFGPKITIKNKNNL